MMTREAQLSSRFMARWRHQGAGVGKKGLPQNGKAVGVPHDHTLRISVSNFCPTAHWTVTDAAQES
jgi:hypothetical protein